MTQIKKVKTSEGVQFYPQTHTKAVIDDNGYTAESRLGAMQDEINQKQLEVGAVPSDLTPTRGSTNWVTSDGIFNSIVNIISPDVIFTSDDLVCGFPQNPHTGKYVLNRYRMGFEINSTPTTVSVSNVPTGYICSIQGYNSKTDAFNSTISPTDFGNWGETTHTFTNNSISFIALNIKNNSSTDISSDDVSNFNTITIINDDSQGIIVDDTPTYGSKNLVRSNGIYNAVRPISSIQNNVNELNWSLYGRSETVSKGLEDAEIVLINSSFQEVTTVTSAFRLRLLYQLPEGASFDVRCTLYSGVAVVLYPTRETAVIGDNDYLENYTNGYSTSEVVGETGYDGYLSISWKNSNGSNFTQSDYDSFIDNVQISITYTDIEDNSVISRLTNLENGEHKRSVNELLSNNINVISHLGGGSFYGTVAPFNSEWSALIAAKMGMRCCEFDIVFTSDDIPICCHDLYIKGGNNEFVRKDGGTISSQIAIGTLTYQNIIDTYEYRHGYAGFKKISTLDDVLAIYRDNSIIPCLEIKNPASEMTAERYNIIIDKLDKYVGLRNCLCIMFDQNNAINLRELSNELLIGISNTNYSNSMIDIAKSYNLFCGLNIDNINSNIINTFKENKVDLYGWTVEYDIDAAIKLGLRMFICDYIAEPNNAHGIVNTYLSNSLNFSNITHNGNISDNHLILSSNQSASLTSNVTSWLSSVESHIYIEGTCTISVNGHNYTVNNSGMSEYIILEREHDINNVSMVINGPCEISSLTFEVRSY